MHFYVLLLYSCSQLPQSHRHSLDTMLTLRFKSWESTRLRRVLENNNTNHNKGNDRQDNYDSNHHRRLAILRLRPVKNTDTAPAGILWGALLCCMILTFHRLLRLKQLLLGRPDTLTQHCAVVDL